MTAWPTPRYGRSLMDCSPSDVWRRVMDKPLGLLAELTYACPLHCPYCSNPLNLGDYSDELTTQQWRQVIDEAAELGVLQLHLSGGEPLQRHDLVDIVRFASGQGMYTNLITSASGL